MIDLDLPKLEQQYNLPSGLLNAVMQTESAGNPDAVSKAGAQGLFQFMPATAKQYGIDPTDPAQSADGAARYYSDLLKSNNGDLDKALASYNFGPGNVASGKPLPQETKDYIAKVKGLLPTQTADSGQIQNDASGGEQSASGGARPSLDDIFSGKAASRPSLDDIFAQPAQAAAQAPQDGFTSNVKSDLAERGNNLQGVLQDALTGKEGVLGSTVLGAGQVAGGINDVIGEGARAVIPQSVANAARSGASGLAGLIDSGTTSIGDTLLGAKDAITNYMQNNPRVAKYAGAVGNIAALLPAGRAGAAIEDTGKAIAKAGEDRAAAANLDAVQKIVQQPETPTVAAENAKRTTVNSYGSKVYNPTAQEKAIAQTAADVGVSPSNTMQKNLNIAQDANNAEADKLKGYLSQNDVNFLRKEFNSKVDTIVKDFTNDPLLAGDAAATRAAEIAGNAFKTIFDGEKGSAAGLLEARKKFDKLIAGWKGQAALDPIRKNALTIAVQRVRQAANDFISAKVPAADVKTSLAKQSNLFQAVDNMDSKAAKEAPTRLGRVGQKLSSAISLKNGIAGLAAGTLGGGAVAAGAAPVVLGGLGAYGAYKGLTSPLAQRAFGGAISKSGGALRVLTGGF